MCLSNLKKLRLPKPVNIKYGKRTYRLIPLWKAFTRYTWEDDLAAWIENYTFKKGFNKDKAVGNIFYHRFTAPEFEYPKGFHCCLTRKEARNYSANIRRVYAFPNSIVATGTQDNNRIVVARRILIK